MKTYLEYLAETEAKYLSEADIPANANKLKPEQTAVLAGAVSMPDISQNKSNGSAYTQYRFGLALGGAHADKDKSYPTEPTGAFSGDPVLLTYTDAEDAMIKNAADMVGAGRILPMGSKRSMEADSTNKHSPHRKVGDIKLNRK